MSFPFMPVRWIIAPTTTVDDPDVFPALPGQGFTIEKTPIWNTKIDTAVSGVERRRALWSYPVWRFQLGYEYMRDGSSFMELQRLVTFFNMKGGSTTGFFYNDKLDNSATAAPLGIGDGSTTAFQPMRRSTIGGITFDEPVRAFNGLPSVFLNGTPVGTNRISYSQQFDNPAWSKNNATVSANAAVAPDSTTTADSLIRTATGNHFVVQSLTGSIFSGETVTFSVWMKLGTLTDGVALRIRDWVGGVEYAINSVTVSGTWARYSVTANVPSSNLSGITVYIDPGDAGAAGETLLLWGAQLEIGPSATTYQPTVVPLVFSVGAFGLITFSSPPAAGATLTWTGNYYFLCRFEKDELTGLRQVFAGVWDLGGLTFRTWKP